MHLDMLEYMRGTSAHHVTNNNVFGSILMVCKNSLYQLGAVNAQSFVESMNFRRNLMVDKSRTSLSNDSIYILVVLNTYTKLLKNNRDQCEITQNLKLSNS